MSARPAMVSALVVLIAILITAWPRMADGAPDLAPTALTAPASAVPRQLISISWTVKNQGSSATQAAWHDVFYLSTTPVCCDAGVTVVMNGYHSTVLAAGASYTQTATKVRIPVVPAGSYYLILVTDATGLVAEADESNNQRAVPMAITTPDLVPTALIAPTSAATATSISVSWTATNQGTGVALPNWNDGIYLSEDAACSGCGPGGFGSMARASHTVPLNPGASYTNTVTFTIPPIPAGTYYIVVGVDLDSLVNDSVYEANETNNWRAVPITITTPDLVPTAFTAPTSATTQQSISVSWTVANQGTGTARSPWSDSVYLSTDTTCCPYPDTLLVSVRRGSPLAPGATYTQTRTVTVPKVPAGQYYLFLSVDDPVGTAVYEADDTNNRRMVPIAITTPDLTPTGVTAPAAAATRQSIAVSWTVKNQGTGPTVGTWNDTLYISPTSTCCTGATSLGLVAHSTTLAAGASYTATKTVTVPTLPAGAYYLIVQTDSGNALFEANGGNNERALPLTITTPDLVPTMLTGPPAASAGQQISVSWTVQNQGTGPTVNGWVDKVSISPNAICCSGATTLGSWSEGPTLAAGGSYSQTKSVVVPTLTAGSYYLILWTDANGQLYEANDGNNQRAVPMTVSGATVGALAITSVNAGRAPLAGTAFAVVVQARNTSGSIRTVTTATAVSLSLKMGAGVLGGTLTGTIPAGASQVTISGVTYTKAESGVVLAAGRTSGDVLSPGDSAPFTVDPGAIASYTVSLSSPEPAGTTFAVSVTARDQFANTVTTDSSTPVTMSSSSGHVLFDSNADGVFGDGTKALNAGAVSLNAKGTAAENTSVIATDANGKTGSAPLTVTAGAASTLAFTTQPGSALASSVIPGPPAVAVQDGLGNTVTSSTASITIAIGTNPSGGTLAGTSTKVATAGVARFDDLAISQPGTGYTLTASAPGLAAATSAAFTITSTTGTISGRVTRASDGSPLTGAVVDALQAGLVKGSMTTGADGTYAITGLAPGTYDVRASAAGHQTQTQAALTVTAGSTATANFILSALPGPTIRITSPAAGSVIDRLTVVVRGEIAAPAGTEVGVSVNDIPGFVDGGHFVALVPVDPTVTALTATASSFSGALATDSIPVTVQASAVDPLISLRATPAGGLAPLTVGFDLSAQVGISQIALDVDGDGTPDFQGGTLTGVSFTLSQPGIYLPQATVTDVRGQAQTATTIVQVSDRAALNQRLQAVWQGVKDALRVGAVAGAVMFIHSDTRDQYREQFDQFSPATLGTVDLIMTTIELVEVGFAGAQYEMLRQQDGQVFSYAVWFQLDQDGLWRLRRF